VDAEPTPNFIHLIMASNSPWVLSVGSHDRRYFVLDVKGDNRQDGSFFDALRQEMLSGGFEALLASLLARDISQFNVRDMPKTDAHREQAEFSLTPEDEWWYEKLRDGEIVAGQGWPEYIVCESLLRDFFVFMRDNRGGRVSTIRLGRILDRVTALSVTKYQLDPKSPVRVLQRDGIERDMSRPYAYGLPSLDRCRDVWRLLGKPAVWPGQPRLIPATYSESNPSDLDEEVLG